MNVLLVAKHSNIEPMGLMALCSELKKDRHKVNYLLLKTGEEEIKLDYDLVGFSAYTGYHRQIFKKSLELSGKVRTVIGGHHATYFSEDCSPNADYVVIGEGLRAIRELCFKNNMSKIIFYPNLIDEKDIPSPDRDYIYRDYPEYRHSKVKSVMSSYGCPYSCTYCFNDSWRKIYPCYKVRYRDVDSVVEECEGLNKYNTELIFFQDDCFGANISWLEEFASKYNKSIPFHCQLRPEMATEDRLKLFKSSGCHGITVAIETYEDSVRKSVLSRNFTNSKVYEGCSRIKEFGFKLRTEQMLGVPLTSFEDEINLLRMNLRINPDIAWVSIFAPYLGTTLGDMCKTSGWYSGNNDDMGVSFFNDSRLNFDKERLRKTNLLHKVFSTCAKFKDGDKLAEEFLKTDGSFNSWFGCMREHLYQNYLYKVC